MTVPAPRRRFAPRGRVVVLGLVAVVTLVGGAVTAGATRAPRSAALGPYYVSLGDSYAIGYQPGRGATRNGYGDQVVSQARRRGIRFQLVNFGCGGATTASILLQSGCRFGALSGPRYPIQTQAAAAEQFLRQHRGQIGLVTVSIGGNDVTMCGRSRDPIGCVTQATALIKRNVSRLARELRAATGAGVPIVGLTYPDVILGQWVHKPVNRVLAQLSVTAFRALINPTLQQAYATGAAGFVDATQASGAYIVLTRTVTLKPYGSIPVAVATVCRLTYYCSVGDIHATTAGYGLIARLIVAALPRT